MPRKKKVKPIIVLSEEDEKFLQNLQQLGYNHTPLSVLAHSSKIEDRKNYLRLYRNQDLQAVAIERGLVSLARKYHGLKLMSDESLREMIKSYYSGSSISELNERDRAVSLELGRRHELNESLILDGTIIKCDRSRPKVGRPKGKGNLWSHLNPGYHPHQ